MNKTLSVFVLLLGFQLCFSQEVEKDPFDVVEHIKYDNGLEVFLAPSDQATNTAVRLEVKVGWDAEKPNEWGVSHLLEHVLFRDKQLKDEMTYLQLIREAGGEANGSTTDRVTSYFGKIPHKKGTWLLDSITKMILEPTIGDEYVKKEKGTVELEIGHPNPISVFFGFNPMDYVYPKYLQEPGFWETEFGLPSDEKFTTTQEQLSNRRLTTEQVKKHYEDYYYASNMRLFIVGRYDRSEVLRVLKEKWASLPNKQGRVMDPLPKISPRKAPYLRRTVYDGSPYVYLGAKSWDVTVRDHEVLDSYTEYLAHRLMKEVRNLKGQTYSANSSATNTEGYGYAYVSFQTQDENLQENIDLVKKHLKLEAEGGGLTDVQVAESKDLYISGYYRQGKEADDMMKLAQWYAGIVRVVGHFESPYRALKEITTEEYNSTLKRYFTPERRYEYTYQPYYFFYNDITVIYFLIALTMFIVLRRLATKKFAHDKVRWIRKIKYPPFMILEAVTLAIAGFVFIHVNHFIHKMFMMNVFQSHILVGEYLRSVVWVGLFLLVCQGALFLLPRKLFIMDNKLIIKSVSYFSKQISLNEITKVEVLRFLSTDFWKMLWQKNIQFRHYYFNPLFLKKGVVFHLSDGKALFFSVSHADEVKKEFESICDELKNPKSAAA